MSKQLKIVVTYFVPLDKLVTDKDFEEQFDSDPAKLERYFTENEGDNWWTEHRSVVQDALIYDPDKKTGEAGSNLQKPEEKSKS